jgi:hypothetical protein
MQAVASLLDERSYELTEALWREWETRFGFAAFTPRPIRIFRATSLKATILAASCPDSNILLV